MRAVDAISSSVQAGWTALLAEVVEQSAEVVDTAMSGIGGTVLRRSVTEVEAEIAVAEEAGRKAKREARKELIPFAPRAQQAAIDAKLDELKAKVHRGRGASAVSA
jgi:hypothetical protein